MSAMRSISRCLVTASLPTSISISVSVAARSAEEPRAPLALSFPVWWMMLTVAPIAARIQVCMGYKFTHIDGCIFISTSHGPRQGVNNHSYAFCTVASLRLLNNIN